jgi:hypothetical protein
MITTDISIDKIDAKEDFMPLELKLSDEASATSDKRSEPRKQRIFQLQCKIYNFESDTFDISDALVHNYGSNGLYFEATNSFQPRDPVCLFLKEQFLDGCDIEFAKGVHAQIVWCKPLNSGGGPRYGVGVKYFEPTDSYIGSL